GPPGHPLDGRGHRAHALARSRLALPAPRRVDRAAVSRGYRAADQAARALGARAQGGPAAAPHAVARPAPGAVVARELPSDLRRAARAARGAPLPALRPVRAALTPLRRQRGQGRARPPVRGRPPERARPTHRPTCRRAHVPQRRGDPARRVHHVPRIRPRRGRQHPRGRLHPLLRDLTEMSLEVEHRLSFDYDAFVRESFIELRMQPKTTPHQTVHSFVLAVGPPTTLSRYRDWNDNLVHHFTITSFHDRIAVAGRTLIATHPAAPPLAQVEDRLPLAGLAYPLWDFLQLGGPIVASAALRRFGAAVPLAEGATLGEQVRAVGRHLHGEMTYRKNVTRFDSTTDDFLSLKAGVCQDFTHLALGLLRQRQIPCRYVSGYLHVEPKGGEIAQSHAWIEFFSPTRGWIPFDPTHNPEIDERDVA